MRVLIGGILAAVIAASGWAKDSSLVVHFKNGDRLSGTMVEENESMLVLSTKLVGLVQIDRSEVKDLVFPGRETETAPESKAESKPSEAAQQRPVQETPPEENRGWFNGRLARTLAAFQLEEWKQRVEFGMTTQSGRRDKTDFSFRYDMSKKKSKNDYRLRTRMLYGETNEQKSTDRTLVDYRWRRDFAPGVFYETLSTYSTDGIKEIELNFEQKMGLGYRFIDQKNLKVSSGGGISGRYREDTTQNDGTSYLVDIFEDIDYRMNERLRLTQEFSLAIPPEQADLYEINFRAAMISEITESLNFTVRYELEYDKSLQVDRREDQRLISSIGLDF